MVYVCTTLGNLNKKDMSNIQNYLIGRIYRFYIDINYLYFLIKEVLI